MPREAGGRVAGRGGGNRRRAILHRVYDADRAGPILERSGGIAAFVFHQELRDADLAGQAREIEQRCPADRPVLRNGGRIERQQLAKSPVVLRPAGEWLSPPGGPHAVEVEANFEDAIVRPAGGAGHLAPGRPVRLPAANANQFADARRHAESPISNISTTAGPHHRMDEGAGCRGQGRSATFPVPRILHPQSSLTAVNGRTRIKHLGSSRLLE